jgi:hypothetical protein
MVKLQFYSTNRDVLDSFLECYLNVKGEVVIMITDNDSESSRLVSLDKETAIKLTKELKKNISFMKEAING